MQTGFDGVVHGICGEGDCIMARCGPQTALGDELMRSLYYGKAYCVYKNGERVCGEVICPCCVVRLFGVGLVGCGVLCRALRLLWRYEINFYGASVSECGIALALPRERMEEAISVLSAELLEKEDI